MLVDGDGAVGGEVDVDGIAHVQEVLNCYHIALLREFHGIGLCGVVALQGAIEGHNHDAIAIGHGTEVVAAVVVAIRGAAIGTRCDDSEHIVGYGETTVNIDVHADRFLIVP